MPYVQRDAAGKISGRYAQSQEAYAEEFVADGHPDLLPPIDTVRKAKLAEINGAFERAAAQLTEGYPPSEKLTWPVQESEAMAWQASNASPTPFINALASARGISRTEYLRRTLAKSTAFRAASALIVGTRQKYEDQVMAASTAGAIEAIAPTFSLA